MKILFLCCLFVLGFSAVAYCGQMSNIELNDGSIIKAEVIGFENGIYTLNTAGFGQIKIDAGKIRKIESLNSSNLQQADLSGLSNTNVKSEVDRLKTKMMADPEISKTIMGLTSDAQFQEILKDPAIVSAVNSGDIQTLMSNQKFMNIVNNPKIEEIRNKIKK